MAPFENADKQSITDSNDSSELKEVCPSKGRHSVMQEDREGSSCHNGRPADSCGSVRNVTSSTTSLQSCTCGPECGPDKCMGREKRTLVGWDKTRSRVFYTLMAMFVIWLVVYIPISLTLF